MQSLCTLTTSSDTFCTAVNEKRKHNGAVGVELGDRVGQSPEEGKRVEVVR